MGVELLYNSVKTVAVAVRAGVRDIDEISLGKPHPAEGAWGPDELGSREDADKMQ